MMANSNRAGLCGRCGNARAIVSGKGSVFVLCELSKSDPRFPKYPSLPVLRCNGFKASDADEADGPM